MGTGPGQIVNDADFTYLAARTYTKDIGKIYRTTAQTLADNTFVAVAFDNESFDTGNFHSTVTNNTRITPTRAGYYRFTGAGLFEAQATPVFSDCEFRKNGTDQLQPGIRFPGQTSAFGFQVTVTMDMNGSTDYMEFLMRQDSAGSDSTATGPLYEPVVEWEFVRDL